MDFPNRGSLEKRANRWIVGTNPGATPVDIYALLMHRKHIIPIGRDNGFNRISGSNIHAHFTGGATDYSGIHRRRRTQVSRGSTQRYEIGDWSGRNCAKDKSGEGREALGRFVSLLFLRMSVLVRPFAAIECHSQPLSWHSGMAPKCFY